MKPTSLLDIDRERTTLEGRAVPIARNLAVAGLVLVAAGLVLGWLGGGMARFFHAYLTNYCFWLSLALGSLFFVGMLHATRAGWAVTVRRIAELWGANFTVLMLLFLPVLLGGKQLYAWMDPATVHGDELLQHKHPYLNTAFFGLRALGYFVAWWFISRFFLERSRQQDSTGQVELTLRMERWSGPSLLALAVTVTFAAFDWLMSLDAHWASTIFGLYYFSGAMVGAFAAIILAAAGLQAAGWLRTAITVEHYHDLGKLLFAFVVFWGYMAFSQYLLIWYANIPEETEWYQGRLNGAWGGVAVALLFGHLVIPFLGLLSREVKRRKPLLVFWAIWLLVFHWLDLQWLVMPNMSTPAFPLAPVDVCLFLGLGCLTLAGVAWTAGSRSLIPLKDPRLAESLAFENI